MDFSQTDTPQLVNDAPFSTEQLPEIIGFCERDPSTHIIHSGDEESYQYKLHGKVVYTVKKKGNKWEIVESDNGQIVRVETATNLGTVLMHILTFRNSDRSKQEELVNILIPVSPEDKDKALVLMYYLGGYPGNFFEETTELKPLLEKFAGQNLSFLSYSYVPVEYVPWLREELKNAGITGQSGDRTIWVYRK